MALQRARWLARPPPGGQDLSAAIANRRAQAAARRPVRDLLRQAEESTPRNGSFGYFDARAAAMPYAMPISGSSPSTAP
jgi:hypothetical protein